MPERTPAKAKTPERRAKDELEKQVPDLDEQRLREEAMKRGLDVKG